MSKGERIKDVAARLEKWAATLAEFDRKMDAFCALTRAETNSPLMDSLHRMESAYTDAVAEQVGDADGWLTWFRWECDMGLRPMAANARLGTPMVKVRTVKQLARLVVHA